MGGGLLQLVAYGAQDAYLSGNPQITFWKGLYKRHTNFAMEPFRVNLTGQADWGVKHSAILPRHADLITNTYLEVELPTTENDTELVYDGGDVSGKLKGMYNLIEYVELDIGGQVIDRLYGEFLYLWSQLTLPYDTRISKSELYAGYSVANQCNATGRPSRGLNGGSITYVPLSFWFARSAGAALPLIALQYHEVKINIVWNKAKNVFVTSQGKTYSAPHRQANLLIDYVYLDVEERRRMAQDSHDYLIEQTQFNEDKGITSANVRLDLTFNHPVKELIWVTQSTARRDCRINGQAAGYDFAPLDYDNIIYDCAIQINGQDRVPALPRTYYTKVQPFQHHSGGSYLGDPITGIHCYSFALKPEEHQPSGTCNFSRIDTSHIVFSVDGEIAISGDESNIGSGAEANKGPFNVRVYAVNYNVLRIMSGMAGLAYSN
jgi:hypothetical protein